MTAVVTMGKLLPKNSELEETTDSSDTEVARPLSGSLQLISSKKFNPRKCIVIFRSTVLQGMLLGWLVTTLNCSRNLAHAHVTPFSSGQWSLHGSIILNTLNTARRMHLPEIGKVFVLLHADII